MSNDELLQYALVKYNNNVDNNAVVQPFTLAEFIALAERLCAMNGVNLADSTCANCAAAARCVYAFDAYNVDDKCLALV